MKANIQVECQVCFDQSADQFGTDTGDYDKAENAGEREAYEFADVSLLLDDNDMVRISTRGVFLDLHLGELRAALKALGALKGHL